MKRNILTKLNRKKNSTNKIVKQNETRLLDREIQNKLRMELANKTNKIISKIDRQPKQQQQSPEIKYRYQMDIINYIDKMTLVATTLLYNMNDISVINQITTLYKNFVERYNYYKLDHDGNFELFIKNKLSNLESILSNYLDVADKIDEVYEDREGELFQRYFVGSLYEGSMTNIEPKIYEIIVSIVKSINKFLTTNVLEIDRSLYNIGRIRVSRSPSAGLMDQFLEDTGMYNLPREIGEIANAEDLPALEPVEDAIPADDSDLISAPFIPEIKRLEDAYRQSKNKKIKKKLDKMKSEAADMFSAYDKPADDEPIDALYYDQRDARYVDPAAAAAAAAATDALYYDDEDDKPAAAAAAADAPYYGQPVSVPEFRPLFISADDLGDINNIISNINSNVIKLSAALNKRTEPAEKKKGKEVLIYRLNPLGVEDRIIKKANQIDLSNYQKKRTKVGEPTTLMPAKELFDLINQYNQKRDELLEKYPLLKGSGFKKKKISYKKHF